MSPEYSGDLLTPREVAEIMGVRTTTIARWAREGRLAPLRTPGGHRRYSRAEIRELLTTEDEPDPEWEQMAEDAVRMYDEGWSIRQVAARFECGYGTMQRLLATRVILRRPGFQTTETPDVVDAPIRNRA